MALSVVVVGVLCLASRSASFGFFLCPVRNFILFHKSLLFLGMLSCEMSSITGIAACFHFNQEILLEASPEVFLFPSGPSTCLTYGGREVKIKMSCGRL